MALRFYFNIIFLSIALTASAQEYYCKVNISTPKLEQTDPKVFENLKSTIEGFMMNQKWTEDVFEQDERINLNISITITKEISPTSFESELQIQATRPVYGSSYETPLISHLDKHFAFVFEQFQPIQYTKNQFNDNLTSMLSFYAYYILGLDYDSFSPYGGDLYFQTAQEIFTALPATAQSSDGWTNAKFGLRNRYWMLESIQNPRCKTFRQAWYEYHRLGLDYMASNSEQGRVNMLKALESIEKTFTAYPTAMTLQMFSNSKGLEMVEIFKEGTPAQKNQLTTTMTKIDPPNSGKYRDLGI